MTDATGNEKPQKGGQMTTKTKAILASIIIGTTTGLLVWKFNILKDKEINPPLIALESPKPPPYNPQTLTVDCASDVTISHEYAETCVRSCFEKVAEEFDCENTNNDEIPKNNYAFVFYPIGNFPAVDDMIAIPRSFIILPPPSPPDWEKYRIEVLGNQNDKFKNDCEITGRYEDGGAHLSGLRKKCKEKLKEYNRKVEAYPQEIAEWQKSIIKLHQEFCQKLTTFGKTVIPTLKSQHPDVDQLTYILNAFVRIGQDIQTSSSKPSDTTIYACLDWQEDHDDPALRRKKIVLPNDISWSGVKIKIYQIPPDVKEGDAVDVKKDVIGWLKENGGIVTNEAIDLSDFTPEPKKTKKRKNK